MPVQRVPSKIAEYVTSIVRGLIDDEASLEVYERKGGSDEWVDVVLDVRVSNRDVGKVVGKSAATVDAIRKLLYTFARKHRLGRITFQVSEADRL